jgi:hypothetical protein
MDLSVGTLVKIKPEAWSNYLLRNGLDVEKPIPSPRVITTMPNHPPYLGCDVGLSILLVERE